MTCSKDSEDKKKTDGSADHPEVTRRRFLHAGAVGAAGLAGALAMGLKTAPAEASQNRGKGDRRVVILVDTETHMMPALAREMARRDHNLVIGNAKEGLTTELQGMGAEVEEVRGKLDLTRRNAVQKLVKAAQKRFGGFDSACIRTGVHGTGDILEAKFEDAQIQYEGNFLSVFLALKALLPPLIAQKSGQVVINTSTSGLRPAPFVALYSAQRAAANALV